MVEGAENCLHAEGFRAAAGGGYRCPLCGGGFDGGVVSRWVREAERARDLAYSLGEGEGSGAAWEEAQREVYRRRRVMYELENGPRVGTPRPEMVLVIHDARTSSYGCRVFYRKPRPSGSVERVEVPATAETILELCSDPDPVVRVLAEKVGAFHAHREKLLAEGEPAPGRRVFYADELRVVG